MKEKMKKFGAWLLAAALAFAGAGVAQAETVTVTSQEELVAAVNAIPANGEGEIILNGGEFTLYHQGANTTGKSIAFIGQVDANGKPATTWNYGGTAKAKGEGSSDYSFDGAGTISFKNVIFKDAIVDDGSLNYCRGFVRAANMAFENCKFGNMIGYWGTGSVSFKDCLFDVDSTYEYSLKLYSGHSFVFDSCTFMGNKKGYIQLFRESDTTRHAVTVRNCKFEAVAQTSKTAVYFYDYDKVQGSCWDIAFEGENVNVGNKIGAHTTSGTWLWGDMQYASAGTAVVRDNGIVVWQDGKKVAPVVEDIKPVMPTASASVEVSAADGETEVVAEDKAAVEAVVTANEAVQATVTGIDAATAGVEASAKYVSVILTAAKVAKTDSATVVKSMTFEVKPCAVTSDGVSVIPNEKITAPITVRFPVDAAVAVGTKADVTHNGVAMTGDFAVAGDDTAKYIEVASATFSTFAYTLIEGGEEPAAVAEVTDAAGKTTKFATLAEAFATVPWVDRPVNGCTVRLLADIDLAGVAWTPVDFCGTFDGNGKTISNLKVQVSSTYAGFFGKFRGEARDVTFEAADVTGGNYAAVFAANVSNAGGASDDNLKMLIENVTIRNSVVKGVQKCGGVIGQFSTSNGSIEIGNCLIDTLSIGGTEGVWQAGGLVGYLQTGISEDAYIHDNTVRNITIDDANVEYFKTKYTHQFFSSAFIGNVINYPFDGGAKDGTVVLEDNTVEGTNSGYQIGPKSNTYIGDYYTQDEVGGSISKVCKIEVDGVDITLVPNYVAEVFASDGTSVKKCATLAEAFAAAAEQTGTAEDPVVIQLFAGTIEEGEITLPDTIKNITLKGAADHASILKNTSLAHRTNGKSFDGLTIDGVVFDNGRFLVVEWGNGSIKNLAFTNNIFRNLDDTTSEAAVHLNVNAAGAVNGFTFENNVIDGCTGGSKSGIYGAVKGNTTIRNNTINNVAFRPLCVQIIDTDGEDDNTVVTGNTFSGSSVGRLQIYGTENETTYVPEGTDGGSFIVNNNIFKGITAAQQICCWGINTEKVTTDITGNYYDAEDPKMFWNDFKGGNSFYVSETDIAANLPHANHDNFNYYTGLTQDGEIDPATLVEVKKSTSVAKIVETGKEYETLQAAFAEMKEGETVELLCDVDLKGEPWTPVALKGGFDGNGFKISNLVINKPEQNGVGFFSNQTVRKAVKDVEFVNVDVKGLCNVGAIFGYQCFGSVENVKVSGTIKVEAMGGDSYGYTRAGVICGGWSYAAYTNVTVDGVSKDTSYVKGPKTGVDGRYVAGFLGHLDEDGYFTNCTVKNLTVEGKYMIAGFCGDGPGRVCTGCTVENIDLKPKDGYSGALFAWLFAHGNDPALVENATIRNVTFASDFECGTVAEYTEDGDPGAVVKNVTIEGVAPLKYNYQVYVTEEGDNFHYANILAAVSDPAIDDLSVITVASDKIEVPAGYELYKKDDLWGVRKLSAVVRVGDIEYSSIEVALANSSGDVEMTLIGNATCGRITLSDADDPQVKSLMIDLNGFTLTDNGGDALLTMDRMITIKDSKGAGQFVHTANDDFVWLQGTKGGVILESGTYVLAESYSYGFAYPANLKSMLVIKGGTYNVDPANYKNVNYLSDGYEAIDNGDGTWTVKEKAPPEVDVKDESGDPEVKDAEGKEIPEEKKEAAEQKAADVKTEVTQTLTEPEVAKFEGTGVAEAATETKTVGDEQVVEVKPAVVEALKKEVEKQEEKDQIKTDSKVESRVEIVFDELEVKVDTSAEEVKATETSVQYEVTPKVKTTVTVEGEEPKVVEAVIPNEVIAGNPIKFRLAVDSTFGDFARVKHTGTDNFLEEYLAEVFTANDASGKKFVELSSDHFSTFKLTSTSETPVCRVGDKNYTSLADAIEKGGATAEIVLVANIELTEDVTLGYNQTIDPGEFTISGAGTVKAADGYEVRIVNGKSVVYAQPTEVTVAGDQKIAVCIEPTVLAELGGAGKLANTAANGFQVWQNYVMGVDGAVTGNKLVPICKPNAENPGAAAVTITTPMTFGAAPAKTGIAVTYQLLKSATPKSGFTMVGEEQAEPVFAVDTSAEENATYWKIQAIFTPDAN